MLCTICNLNTLKAIGETQGYVLGSSFTVFQCSACETSVVYPCRSDENLYDAIYRNVSRVPGYSRYFFLADELLRVRDPLAHMARTEDGYYAIVEALRDRGLNKSRTRICEVGCGQGYLTYSLVKAGFDCTGIDISESAVALARQRYGDHYFCGTVEEFCAQNAKADVIVATEVIEHLEDPVRFVQVLLGALREHGTIVLTTPNKPLSSPNLWDTELPPVHLWWFTKPGMQAIATQLGCDVKFVDFADFYRANPQYRLIDRELDRSPIFDKRYQLIAFDDGNHSFGLMKRRLKQFLPNFLVRQIQKWRAGDRYEVIGDENSYTIGAIFRKSPSAGRL